MLQLQKNVKRRRKNTSEPFKATRDKSASAAIAPNSSARRWCFRFVGLIIPFLSLAILELGLRFAGFGFPTTFFLRTDDNGRVMVVNNPRFGWRFFPPTIARAPRPLYFPGQKPPNSVRIFVFGESAAMGDPEPAYGFARQLERLLQARHPNQKIEIVNAAMTAINSHVIREIARDCQSREGDFWLVYAGNNEVIGPFGAGTIFGRRAPSLATVRGILALKKTRLGQMLAQLTRNADERKEWEGLEFFLKWQIALDSPGLKRVYDSFTANLNDVADLARRSGAPVLLATVPVNLRDFSPLASVHRADLQTEQSADWQKLFSAGTNAQATGNFTKALANFRKAAEIDDRFAELVFQRARCETELKQTAAAETDFRRARDLDALRFRADSRLNEIVRETAKTKSLSLIDADAELSRPGDEKFFYDHVHLNLAGNYRVALLFAMELEKLWPGPETNNSPWITEAEVAQRLAFTAFDERRIGEEMRARMQQPPFKAQSNFRERDERWAATLAALAVPTATCVSNYLAAVVLAPDDWILYANFARVLEGSGDNTGAAKQWSEVSRLMPHSPEGWANQGKLARIGGDADHAKSFLAEALKQQPDSVETLGESGVCTRVSVIMKPRGASSGWRCACSPVSSPPG
jgi:tetratricopeptide (TPR) repeat protein